MAVNVTLKFAGQLTESEADNNSVLIIGQKSALSALTYEDIKIKFGSSISKELYENGIQKMKSSSTDVMPLYMKCVTLARLPSSCSRYNTPSQAHALTKLVKNNLSGGDEYVVILCDYGDVFASACAVARCFPLFSKKAKHENSPRTIMVEFIVTTNDGTEPYFLTESDLNCLTVAAEGIRLAAKIVDSPCSDMNTDDFLQEITEVGAALSIEPLIIRGEELKKRGFGGLYSVGQAAEHPAALAVLSHIVPDAKETIAWVGKGIVFDTGGLFVKSRATMVGMKRDCGGAASILGAFYHAVKMGFKENLHAIFCLAENAVGPKATRPDDIITLYSGKTVEVNNTDAEGRLVLGDGVAYAKKDLQATTILDMATLTGAQGVSTGRYHGALVTNREYWEKVAVEAGRTSGDLIHPMPYAPEIHFNEFNSAMADMKNAVADNANAQVSCAGLFIGSHIGFDFDGNWIHVDMAKTAFSGERATGYGVALLSILFGHLSQTPLLQNLSPIYENKQDGDKSASADGN